MGHLATRLLPNALLIQKFRTTHVCTKDREKHRNKVVLHVFRGHREQYFNDFVPFEGLGIAGAVSLKIL